MNKTPRDNQHRSSPFIFLSVQWVRLVFLTTALFGGAYTPQPDGHYLLDSLGASQSRDPDYSMSGVYASTRGRAQ
uniref:Uncharacterized protein n=1 Tax=Hyaloperonospora arabidopsidis (strain Emoy2) TaxID=559515 RepID=M4BIW7_HYAAE